MPNQPDELDLIFQALGDSTRRSVLERLGRGPAPVSELAREFDMALPSFLQHLRMLESRGLVISRKNGRVRTCELAPEPLRRAQDWLAQQRSLWERRLDQLDSFLQTLKNLETQADSGTSNLKKSNSSDNSNHNTPSAT